MQKRYNKMVDWWSVGILLYEMATGHPPYNDKSYSKIMLDIVQKGFEPKDWFSKELTDLLHKLLVKDPSYRLGSPRMGGIAALKSHPFFSGINWEALVRKEIEPPIKPEVKDAGDYGNIDNIFLKEEVQPTPPSQSYNMNLLNKLHFDQFTYNEETVFTKHDSPQS